MGVPVIPTVTASGPTTFCAGNSITLNSSPAVSYAWSTSDVSQAITASAAGPYTVTVTDAYGCVTTSQPVIINILPGPIAAIQPPGPVTVCAGNALVLMANGGTSWSWSNGPTTQSITVTSNGTFTVTATDSSGCFSTSVPTIVTFVNPVIPTITAGGPTSFCQGGQVILTSSPAPGYTWNPGNIHLQTYTVYNSGNYSVTTMDQNGCSGTSLPIAVTVNPAPQVPIITQNGNTLSSSVLTGNQWYLNGVLIPGATNQTYTLTQNGVYTVSVIAAGCGSTSSPFNAVFVGIDPLLQNWNFGIFPNPAQGKFTIRIEGKSAQPIHATIVNLLGQKIYETDLELVNGMADTQVDITEHGAAVYLLHLSDGEAESVTRIVVE